MSSKKCTNPLGRLRLHFLARFSNGGKAKNSNFCE